MVVKRKATEASLAGLLLASPAAPFFGPAVIVTLYGVSSGLMIATVALVINVTQVPLGIVLMGGERVVAGAARGIGRWAAVAVAQTGADVAGINLCAPANPIDTLPPADLAMTAMDAEPSFTRRSRS